MGSKAAWKTIIPPQAHSAKSTNEPVAGSRFVAVTLRWPQTGTLGKQPAQGCLTVIFAHGCLAIGGSQVFRMRLMRAPLHEEAVADAPEQPSHKPITRAACKG